MTIKLKQIEMSEVPKRGRRSGSKYTDVLDQLAATPGTAFKIEKRYLDGSKPISAVVGLYKAAKARGLKIHVGRFADGGLSVWVETQVVVE